MVQFGLKNYARMIFGRGQSQTLRILPGTSIDYDREIGDVSNSDIVEACVNWMLRTFPEAPVMLERVEAEGQRQREWDHPFLDLLEVPNPAYDSRVLWMATLEDYIYEGEAYWLIVGSRVGAPVELWHVPHDQIRPIIPDKDSKDYILGYEYKPGDKEYKLPVENVVHFRFGLGKDGRHGRKQLESASRELWTDSQAGNWTASLLRNYGTPGVVISPKGEKIVSSDDLAATRDYISQQFSGDGRGKPLALGTAVTVAPFGYSPEQMNLRDIRTLPEERVTALLGLPAVVAGFGAGLERSTFANVAEAREMAYEALIIPTQAIMASALRLQLLSRYEAEIRKLNVSFDLSNVRVLQEDENTKTTRWNSRVLSGWATVAEAREANGLPVDEEDKVYLRPLNTMAVKQGEDATLMQNTDDPNSQPDEGEGVDTNIENGNNSDNND